MREAGNGRRAIKDQEEFGFGSFRQMNKDADALSVTVSEEFQEDETVWHAWFRSPCTACQVWAARNTLLVSVPGHFVQNKQTKPHTKILGLVWVSRTCSFF